MNTIFRIHTVLIISSIILLPGCTIVNWAKKNLYQGIDFNQNYTIPRSFIRSVKAYNEFSTFAHFNVLWLSEEVRNAYVSCFVDATGKQEEQKNQLLRSQKDELKHFITFYVVAPQETILTTDQSSWHMILEIDELKFDPIEIKVVELNNIYKSFFGNLCNRFKTVYQVKFEARDLYDNPLIISTTQAIELHFKKLNKEVFLRWDLLNVPSDSPIKQIDKKSISNSSEHSHNEHARLRKKIKRQ